MSKDTGRGIGRTLEQMLYAPRGAVFVWCNGVLQYPRDLARKHDRQDLEIVGPDWLEDGRWQGRSELTGVVVDHACELTERQWIALRLAAMRVRPV